MDGHRLIHTNGTLLLRAVKAEDSGYYTCTATNTGGFDTIIVNLLVQGEMPQGGEADRALLGTGMEEGEESIYCMRAGGPVGEEVQPLGRQMVDHGRGGRRGGEEIEQEWGRHQEDGKASPLGSPGYSIPRPIRG